MARTRLLLLSDPGRVRRAEAETHDATGTKLSSVSTAHCFAMSNILRGASTHETGAEAVLLDDAESLIVVASVRDCERQRKPGPFDLHRSYAGRTPMPRASEQAGHAAHILLNAWSSRVRLD